MSETISTLINTFIQQSIEFQKEDGSFAAGHNGPYMDLETPVRNTAHFLFLLSSMYENTKNKIYKNSAYKAIEYIFSKESRPYDITFYHRDKENKDHCNGLIGQAWVIEALVKASEVFDRSDCYELAEEVFLLHPFDEDSGLWNKVEIDGSILGFDRTFNHQLWFAMAGALLTETSIAQSRAKIFMQKVGEKVELYQNGTIYHMSELGSLWNCYKQGIGEFKSRIKQKIIKSKRKEELYFKSVGYHGFNLYAFSLLCKAFPELDFWKSKRFEKLLNAPSNILFQADLVKSEFGYFYNISGVEIAFAYEYFGKKHEDIQKWLNYQIKYTFQDHTNLFTKASKDFNTAQARVYELTRINGEYEIEINLKKTNDE